MLSQFLPRIKGSTFPISYIFLFYTHDANDGDDDQYDGGCGHEHHQINSHVDVDNDGNDRELS